jgi:hypothetical protein
MATASGLTVHQLPQVQEGDLDPLIEPLASHFGPSWLCLHLRRFIRPANALPRTIKPPNLKKCVALM